MDYRLPVVATGDDWLTLLLWSRVPVGHTNSPCRSSLGVCEKDGSVKVTGEWQLSQASGWNAGRNFSEWGSSFEAHGFWDFVCCIVMYWNARGNNQTI